MTHGDENAAGTGAGLRAVYVTKWGLLRAATLWGPSGHVRASVDTLSQHCPFTVGIRRVSFCT